MTVHLVGAGPGDPGLLTRRAAELLSCADHVVHDSLVDDRVLELVPPAAEVIDVGKRGGRPSWRQRDIDALLIELGSTGRSVVRLKGGDPFVFGRGGEESAALCAAGIDVELVPGVSSALAGPAAAGIPVTQRGVASGVTIVTAHQDPDSDPLDWAAFARTGTTLVVLMGARRASELAERLQREGLSPTTPVAVVTDAWRSEQRTTRLALAELGRRPVAAPSVIVIGAAAALDVRQVAAASLELAA